MEKEIVPIRTATITMDKLLKLTGIASTGGQAFMMVESGEVLLNGQVVQEKRRQVRPGDVVTVSDQVELVITKREA